MIGFDDVTLAWGGETYVVPADRQMELIARVEDGLIGGKDVQAWHVLARKSGPPVALLSRVYAGALRYAGANVDDRTVFMSLSGALARGDGGPVQDAIVCLMRILNLMAAESEPGETAPAKKTSAPEAS